MPAATAAAEPLDEPPGEYAGSGGLRVLPEAPHANSVVTVLPMMTAPAARSCVTTAASRDGVRPAWIGEPFSVGMSAVSMMSLTAIGTPWSGPIGCPDSRHWSAARAWPSAWSGSRNAHASMRASVSRTRARHAATYCSEAMTPSRMSRAASAADSACRLLSSIAAKVAGIIRLCKSARSGRAQTVSDQRSFERGLRPRNPALGGGTEERAARRATMVGRGAKPPSESLPIQKLRQPEGHAGPDVHEDETDADDDHVRHHPGEDLVQRDVLGRHAFEIERRHRHRRRQERRLEVDRNHRPEQNRVDLEVTQQRDEDRAEDHDDLGPLERPAEQED